MKRIIKRSAWKKLERHHQLTGSVLPTPSTPENQTKRSSIWLSQSVLARLEATRVAVGNLEFSGLGFVDVLNKQIDTIYDIYDVVLLDVGSPGYTEIPSDKILSILDRSDAEKMKLWFHRHPLGNNNPGLHNWSSIDNQTIEKEPLGGIPELVEWSISIVRTPQTWVGRVDHYLTEGVQTQHLPVYIHADPTWMAVLFALHDDFDRQPNKPFSR